MNDNYGADRWSSLGQVSSVFLFGAGRGGADVFHRSDLDATCHVCWRVSLNSVLTSDARVLDSDNFNYAFFRTSMVCEMEWETPFDASDTLNVRVGIFRPFPFVENEIPRRND